MHLVCKKLLNYIPHLKVKGSSEKRQLHSYKFALPILCFLLAPTLEFLHGLNTLGCPNLFLETGGTVCLAGGRTGI